MKRSLIPLNPLRSFEAAARLLSYTLAAEELCVTQVAVSRQVRVLEEYLQIPLFDHGVRTLTLTDAGRSLLPVLTQALDQVELGVSSITRRGRPNTISIQVYTAFSQRWLIPRLAQFKVLHPGIEVSLRTSDQSLSFERQNVDAAIISAPAPPKEYPHVFLAERKLTPVCSPTLLKSRTLPLEPESLHSFTLLHSVARPEAWREWLDGANCRHISARNGTRFETSSMAIGAAIAGLGIAVAATQFIEDDLRSGVLVAPFIYVHPSPRKYYVTYPEEPMPNGALAVFIEWIAREAGRDIFEKEELRPSD